MKRNFLLLALLFFVSFGHAQEKTKLALFTTGGTFFGQDNLVTIYKYDIENDELSVLDQALGDFSNGVLRDHGSAYAHIGRSTFNPNPIGEETIYKYDLKTGERIDSIVGVFGAFKFEVFGDFFIVGKGFDAMGSFLEVYDKNNLAAGPIFTDGFLTNPVGGMVIFNGRLYVSFSGSGIGQIARYDLSGTPVFDGVFPLDDASAGLGDLITDGNVIYGFSENYDPVTFQLLSAGITRFDLSNNTFETKATALANTPLGVVNGMVFGNFGSDGNTIDGETLQPGGNTFLPFFSAGEWDRINEVFYLQETDFSSFGKVSVVNLNGEVLNSFDTDISGTGIDLAFNHPPVFTVNDLYLFIPTGDPHFEDLSELVIDEDNEELTFKISMPPMWMSAELDGDILTLINLSNTDFDDMEITVTDGLGCSDVLLIYADLGIIGTSTEELFGDKEVTVFPNPTIDFISLDLTDFENGIAEVRILNSNLQTVFQAKQETRDKLKINVNDLPDGAYLVLLKGEKEGAFGRFMKF